MLKSDNVYLGPLLAADLLQMFKWINDRELVLNNAAYKPIAELQHREWFENIQKRDDSVIFGIYLQNSNELVGSCQLLNINWKFRQCELQIRIGEAPHRGKGLGTEALQLLVKHGFDDLNLRRIFLHVFAENKPARALYKKAGFIEEGTLREAAYLDGAYHDVIIMGLLRKEYKNKPVLL